mmetsp:Transcript_34160/g.66143  ORF Transcript_34160/g.66143 Transcript_34160/m.66143 type:complete len:123 (-) Transcript_34160:698-1066(-)
MPRYQAVAASVAHASCNGAARPMLFERTLRATSPVICTLQRSQRFHRELAKLCRGHKKTPEQAVSLHNAAPPRPPFGGGEQEEEQAEEHPRPRHATTEHERGLSHTWRARQHIVSLHMHLGT